MCIYYPLNIDVIPKEDWVGSLFIFYHGMAHYLDFSYLTIWASIMDFERYPCNTIYHVHYMYVFYTRLSIILWYTVW